jgi:hypothetical protein
MVVVEGGQLSSNHAHTEAQQQVQIYTYIHFERSHVLVTPPQCVG